MTGHKMFAPDGLKLAESGQFEAAFAQLGVVDFDGDLTLPGAFTTKEVPMSAYNHTSWDGALPVGKGTVTEQGDWAVFTGEFFMNTSHGRDAYETVKALGPLNQFSYGYVVLDSSPGVHEGKNVRVLKSLEVHEVAPVLVGAGRGTHLRSIKSGGLGTDLPYAEHLSGVLDAVKALYDRTEGKADWRAKEGRVLSAANLTTLRELADMLGVTAQSLVDFLAAHDPQKAAPRSVTLDVLLATARRYGVTV